METTSIDEQGPDKKIEVLDAAANTSDELYEAADLLDIVDDDNDVWNVSDSEDDTFDHKNDDRTEEKKAKSLNHNDGLPVEPEKVQAQSPEEATKDRQHQTDEPETQAIGDEEKSQPEETQPKPEEQKAEETDKLEEPLPTSLDVESGGINDKEDSQLISDEETECPRAEGNPEEVYGQKESPPNAVEAKSGEISDSDTVRTSIETVIAQSVRQNITSTNTKTVNNSDAESELIISSDDEDDDDFDPQLLVPEMSMDVEESPVITSSYNSNPMLYGSLSSPIVDEVTGAEISFNLTPVEQQLRQRRYGIHNRIETKRIHCTACNVHLGSHLDGQKNRFVHPLLKVLLCKRCYQFYMSDEFEKDEDGSELYCRWCGQGGQVLCCTKCECVFCKKCIRINFGQKKINEIRDSDDWTCFKCDMRQISDQRVACAELFDYLKMRLKNAKNSSFLHDDDQSTCCRDGADGVRKRAKKKIVIEDEDYVPPVESPLPSPIAMPPLVPKPQFVPNIVTAQNPPTLRPLQPGKLLFNPGAVQTIYQAMGPSPNSIRRVGTLIGPPMPRLLVPNAQTQVGAKLEQEWFDKTVRASARVNSQLSYSLSQLSKAQSSARNLPQMADVHNKLQEILSSSINALIHIRKNLRTEFISGIKNVKFNPKVAPATASPAQNSNPYFIINPINSLVQAGTSGVVPKATPVIPVVYNEDASEAVLVDDPKWVLKVKSLVDLQKKPSDFITILDDSDPPALVATKDPLCLDEQNVEVEVKKITESKTEENKENKTRDDTARKVPRCGKRKLGRSQFCYNIKDDPPADVKRMCTVEVRLERLSTIHYNNKLTNHRH